MEDPGQTLSLECSSCGATLVVEPQLRSTRCAYCDSPAVIERPPAPDRPRPRFALGFAIDGKSAIERVRRWIGSRGFFTHRAFKRASPDKTHGVYLPAYLYSATAESRYRAAIGEHYWVTVGSGKNKRRERRTEWHTLAGEHACYLRDLLVSASKGLANHELEAVEPFDLRGLRRYGAELISGWAAEDPSLSEQQCLQLAREEGQEELRRRLSGFLPGDEARLEAADSSLSNEVIELVLLPVWIFAVRWHAKQPPVRVVLNGQTGAIAGEVPTDWRRVMLVAIATAAVVLGALALLLGS